MSDQESETQQNHRVGFLGIVMLDTRFPRPPGDVGHPDTFGVPTRQRVVRGAWPQRVVATADALRAAGVTPAFEKAVAALVREGAFAITTSCGFLVLLQAELQAAARVPMVTSSLLQLPALLRQQAQVGVLTISRERLGEEHLLAAGVPAERLGDVMVEGVDASGEFSAAILGNRETMDFARAESDVVRAAERLKGRAPAIRTVVLECTNMPPYRNAIGAATGFDVRSLVDDPRLKAITSPCPSACRAGW